MNMVQMLPLVNLQYCSMNPEHTPYLVLINEPGREKNGLLGFRPGLAQAGLNSHKRKLEPEILDLRRRRHVLFVKRKERC